MSAPNYSDLGDKPYHPEANINETVVGQDSWAEITSGSMDRKTIATFDLLGCIGLGLIINKADGTRVAYIQHYRQDREIESILALAEAIERNQTPDRVRARAVIVAPQGSPGTENLTNRHMRTNTTELLTRECAKGLGPDVSFYVHLYNPLEFRGDDSVGSLAIELDSEDTDSFFIEGSPIAFPIGV